MNPYIDLAILFLIFVAACIFFWILPVGDVDSGEWL